MSTNKVARGITTCPPADDFIAKSPTWSLKSQKKTQSPSGAGQIVPSGAGPYIIHTLWSRNGECRGCVNNDVVFAGKRRIKQTSLELLHLLMQHSPCSDKAMQSLETSFRFSNLRTPTSTLFGWTITMASSNEGSSSKSLKSLLLIRSQYVSRAFCLASSQPQRS
jgi:hypothetical protein